MNTLTQQIEEAAKSFLIDKKYNSINYSTDYNSELKRMIDISNFALSLLLPILEDATKWREVKEELPDNNIGECILETELGVYYEIGSYSIIHESFLSQDADKIKNVKRWRPIESDLLNKVVQEIKEVK